MLPLAPPNLRRVSGSRTLKNPCNCATAFVSSDHTESDSSESIGAATVGLDSDI